MKMALELKAAGRLRWCQSQVCACMGCANTYPGMNKEKWDRIKMIPFVQKIINERKGNVRVYEIYQGIKMPQLNYSREFEKEFVKQLDEKFIDLLIKEDRLNWCDGPCACMGTCANTHPMMNKVIWERISQNPRVEKILEERANLFKGKKC